MKLVIYSFRDNFYFIGTRGAKFKKKVINASQPTDIRKDCKQKKTVDLT